MCYSTVLARRWLIHTLRCPNRSSAILLSIEDCFRVVCEAHSLTLGVAPSHALLEAYSSMMEVDLQLMA